MIISIAESKMFKGMAGARSERLVKLAHCKRRQSRCEVGTGLLKFSFCDSYQFVWLIKLNSSRFGLGKMIELARVHFPKLTGSWNAF